MRYSLACNSILLANVDAKDVAVAVHSVANTMKISLVHCYWSSHFAVMILQY